MVVNYWLPDINNNLIIQRKHFKIGDKFLNDIFCFKFRTIFIKGDKGFEISKTCKILPSPRQV